MHIFSAPNQRSTAARVDQPHHTQLDQLDPDVLSDFTLDELRELPCSVQMGIDLTALD